MKLMRRTAGCSVAALLVTLLGACASMGGGDISLRATGAEEVPPVSTSATATGTLQVGEDRSVSGSFRTQGSAITAAHIHEAPSGSNGPVIVPLVKKGDNEWVVPPDRKLTAAQYEAFKAGRLYVNFHSAAHKGGEVRAQIRPSGSGGGRSGY